MNVRPFRVCAWAAALILASQAGLATSGGAETAGPEVGAQYDGAHVYLAPADVEPFVKSFTATFGGQFAKPATTTVTPTSSSATFVAVRTPAGRLSAFGFTTPIPYPFGSEPVGYLVKDLDAALTAATAAGADVIVSPFADPIGRDAIIRWPGGATMQLYRHTKAPSFPPLETVPEQHVYFSALRADTFVRDFVTFSRGRVVSDEPHASGVEIGRPGERYRRTRIASDFGRLTVLATDGHLPFRFGRETYGYETADLADTLKKAEAAGAAVIVQPFKSTDREAAVVRFPGGYIAEIHRLSHP